jgi:uncharacterized membrane protein
MSPQTLHPMVVHFPIALLLTAFLFETIALTFKINDPLLRRISFWNLVLGTWGGLAAVLPGGVAATTVQLDAASRIVMDRHVVFGCVSFVLSAAVCSWHLAKGKKMRPRSRWIAWALLGITCLITALTGDLGGSLVYEHQVMVK